MFSEAASFELYNSVILEYTKTEDKIVLKCLYMNFEIAYITYGNVTAVVNEEHLKGNTISHTKVVDDGYEIHYINEAMGPTIIKASNQHIDWK